MYLNRKKPSRKEKQVKEISKSETNLQIEKKE